jgi:hypothetical protein
MSHQSSRGQRRPSAPRKNTKLTGERSEAAFLARAANLGFGIAKPWGDSRRYDFILDNGECLHRIQVKCTESIRARAYETRATYTTGKGRAVYTRQDIDFIAAHVVPLDLWYIIPVEVCTPAPMLRFYPHRQAKIMRLEPYREAWDLILPRQSNHVMDLRGSADQTIYPDADGLDTHSLVILSAPRFRAKDLCNLPCGPGAPARELLKLFRELCQRTPATIVPPSLAPWPIPPLKILVPREGKRILSNPAG